MIIWPGSSCDLMWWQKNTLNSWISKRLFREYCGLGNTLYLLNTWLAARCNLPWIPSETFYTKIIIHCILLKYLNFYTYNTKCFSVNYKFLCTPKPSLLSHAAQIRLCVQTRKQNKKEKPSCSQGSSWSFLSTFGVPPCTVNFSAEVSWKLAQTFSLFSSYILCVHSGIQCLAYI